MNANEALWAVLNAASQEIVESGRLSEATRTGIADALADCGPERAQSAYSHWELGDLELERRVDPVLDPVVREHMPRKPTTPDAARRSNSSPADLAGLVIAAVKELADEDGIAPYQMVKEWCVANGASDGGALDRRYKGAALASSSTTNVDARLYAQGVSSNYAGGPLPPVAERWFTLG